MHPKVFVRAAISATTARVYLSAVGVEGITGSADPNDDRPSVVIHADRAFEVGGAVTGLPYAGDTDATPRVSDWTLAAYSVTGLASYTTTLTWPDGMVLDVVSIECDECDDGNDYRLEVNLKLDAADPAAGNNANTLCGGGGSFAAAVDASTGVSLFGAAATTVVGTACTAGIAAYSAPASRDVDGRSTCRQCSRVGLEAECLDLLDAGGSSSVGTVADVCRARFRNERGYARRKILDPSSPSWTAGLGDGASSLVSDTVTQFEAYPSMEAFDRAAASAEIILESEFVISGAVQYVAGLHRQLGDVKKTRGIPHETSGSTSRRAEWPYPHIQDECRGPVDLQSGGEVSPSSSSITAPRSTRCSASACAGRRFPPSSASTEPITPTFRRPITQSTPARRTSRSLSLPGKISPTRYEVRLVYTTTATGTETYNASYVVGGATTILGDYELKKPELTRGSAGFETEPLSSGADVTVALAAASASHAVTIVSATVRAANPAQVSRGFPPYAGYAQTTCGVFESGRCGDMTFTAEADSEYFISITGKGAAEGEYSFQMMKMYGAVTTLRATSDNPALSVVASNDGTVERRIGGKLAKIGDVLTIEVTSGRVIDKPVIEVNGVVVQPGLVVGSGRSWEAMFTVRRAHGFADGQLNVTANRRRCSPTRSAGSWARSSPRVPTRRSSSSTAPRPPW